MKLACWILGILKRYAVVIPGCSFSGFRKALFWVFTCIFALGIVLLLPLPLDLDDISTLDSTYCTGGATVGIITGALKCQTTETGFVRGAGIGAVTGAVTAVQLLELIINGESLSKFALICSLVDMKLFMEWVGPAVLKAYQWQVSSLETRYMEISDIYDTDDSARGLPQSLVERLPVLVFEDPNHHEGVNTCSICLQEFEGRKCGRRLPTCGHVFHRGCLDSWLIRCGTCPMCRDTVCERDDDGIAFVGF